jgi:hypothetical protein
MDKGTQYLITVNKTGQRYVGTYDKTKINLNGNEVYVFKMVYRLVPREPFARETTFATNSVTISKLGQSQSVLGKNERKDEEEQVQVQEEKRYKEEENQYTEKELEEDIKFWESVDGGSLRQSRKKRRKSKKIKSRSKRRTKRRKSNK